MSPRRSLSRLATDLLGKETVDVAAPSAEVDARTIAAVSDAIHRARARRRARRIGIALGAIAAAAALVVGVRSMRHVEAPVIAARVTLTGHAVAGGVVLLHEGREIPLEGGSTIVAGDRLVAASDGRAAVSLSTGSHVIVEGGADVVVAKQDAEQVFDLSAGSLRADVAKLAPNERFVVRTPDAEVEVRGTSFR
ncbi:MAG TPA: FecR family protein, partial [Polyangiaceae bacterium]